MTREAKRAAAGGFAFTALTSASAFAKSVEHGIGITVALLLTVCCVVAIVQYGSRPSRPTH